MAPTQSLTLDPQLFQRKAASAPAVAARLMPGDGPGPEQRRVTRTYLVATVTFLMLAAVDTCISTTYVSGNWWLVLLLIWLMPWPARPFDMRHPAALSWDALKQSLAVAVIGWVYFRANTALIDVTYHWEILHIEGKLRALNVVLQDVVVGLVTAALLARPVYRAFTSDSVRVAALVAAPFFVLTCSDTVFDVARWRDKPLANMLFLFEALFLPLLLMQACAVLQRRNLPAAGRNPIATPPVIARLGTLFDRCPRWFAPSIIQPVLMLTMVGIAVRAYCEALPALSPAANSMTAAILPLCALLLTAATVHHFRSRRLARRNVGWWPRVRDTLDATFASGILAIVWTWVLCFDAPLAEYYARGALAAVPGPAWAIDYDVRTKTLRLSGEYQYGVASAFAAELHKHPGVQAVELEGPGGLIGEGLAIANVIETRNLSTLVRNDCASACTIAFMSGKERTLVKNASLGFHSASTPVVNLDANEYNDRYFMDRGVDAAFVERASKVPHDDMWYPTNETLLAARVVTDER